MRYPDLAQKIIALKDADLQLRDRLVRSGELGKGYNKEMQRLHDQNAAALEYIIDRIGYPTVEQVGKAASEATWLVIQHSIGKPAFMQKCERLLSEAVEKQQVPPKNLAYLSDRIAVLEGKPQRYGTQFDWDEEGQLSPLPCEDLTEVNRRRATLGLKSLEEQTRLIRTQAVAEIHKPPADLQARKQEMEAWRRKVGWV